MKLVSPQSVLVALSGGVDSSVCAHLLQERGMHVEAVVCYFSAAHSAAVAAAQAAAEALQITLHIVDCQKLFEEEVIKYFANSYRNGKTPNPCVVCNPKVKFDSLLNKADELGLDAIATGHYADVAQAGERYFIRRCAILSRDQSYMLYRLSQNQLSRLLLPLAGMPKDQVRAIAAEINLPCADMPDSQEICFIPDGDYPQYIRERFGAGPQGNFISPDGKPCGKHKGLEHYTVGQRKGLGLSLGRRVSIRQMDPATGNIYLADYGTDMEESVMLSDCVYLPFDEPEGIMSVEAKIRSQAIPVKADLLPLPGRRAKIQFKDPQRAPAPGQSCVLYQGDGVVGGGFIDNPDVME